MKISIKSLFIKSHWLILITGFVISLVLFGYVFRQEQERAASEFSYHANEEFNRIGNRIESNLDVNNSLQSFFESSQEVTRGEFRRFVKSILKRHSEIQLIGWAPLVSTEKIELYEQAAHADGFSDFQIGRKNQPETTDRVTERNIGSFRRGSRLFCIIALE